MPSPPPSIINTNIKWVAVRIDEKQWNKATAVEAVGSVKLTDDREVKGIWIDEKSSSDVYLNGKLLTVGGEGINFSYSEKQPYLRGGKVTSSTSSLIIRAGTHGSSNQIDEYGNPIFLNAHLRSVIQDHKDHKVGLTMTGHHPVGESGIISISGGEANTFTGDTVVEGVRNMLFLAKSDGVTSIRGNIFIKNGGRLALSNSDQIADHSVVTLSGKGSIFSFSGNLKNNSEKIHSLVIDSGSGVFGFSHPKDAEDNASRTLYLDDLIIREGASLHISA